MYIYLPGDWIPLAEIVTGKAEKGKLLQREQVWEENWCLLCPQFLEILADKACDWSVQASQAPHAPAFEHLPTVAILC